MYHSSLQASASIVNLGIRMQQYIANDSVNGDKHLAKNFQNLTSYSILQAFAYGSSSSVTGLDQSQPTASLAELLRQEWDRICPTFDCSAVVFESYGSPENSLFQAVNAYNVQFGQLTDSTFNSSDGLTLPRQMW